MTGDRDVVATLGLDGVIPVRWSGPSLNPDSPKVAMETVELAHHGFLPGQGGGGGQTMSTPIALMTSAAQADLAKPGDAGAAGGKPVKGRPKMDKAQLTLYDPSPRPTAAAARARSAVRCRSSSTPKK